MSGGKIIRAMRTERGYTQAELSDFTGFSESSIQNWESGDIEPRFNAVHVIAIALHFTLDEALELAKNAKDKKRKATKE